LIAKDVEEDLKENENEIGPIIEKLKKIVGM
jgi:hypothetical protein